MNFFHQCDTEIESMKSANGEIAWSGPSSPSASQVRIPRKMTQHSSSGNPGEFQTPITAVRPPRNPQTCPTQTQQSMYPNIEPSSGPSLQPNSNQPIRPADRQIPPGLTQQQVQNQQTSPVRPLSATSSFHQPPRQVLHQPSPMQCHTSPQSIQLRKQLMYNNGRSPHCLSEHQQNQPNHHVPNPQTFVQHPRAPVQNMPCQPTQISHDAQYKPQTTSRQVNSFASLPTGNQSVAGSEPSNNLHQSDNPQLASRPQPCPTISLNNDHLLRAPVPERMTAPAVKSKPIVCVRQPTPEQKSRLKQQPSNHEVKIDTKLISPKINPKFPKKQHRKPARREKPTNIDPDILSKIINDDIIIYPKEHAPFNLDGNYSPQIIIQTKTKDQYSSSKKDNIHRSVGLPSDHLTKLLNDDISPCKTSAVSHQMNKDITNILQSAHVRNKMVMSMSNKSTRNMNPQLSESPQRMARPNPTNVEQIQHGNHSIFNHGPCQTVSSTSQSMNKPTCDEAEYNLHSQYSEVESIQNVPTSPQSMNDAKSQSIIPQQTQMHPVTSSSNSAYSNYQLKMQNTYAQHQQRNVRVQNQHPSIQQRQLNIANQEKLLQMQRASQVNNQSSSAARLQSQVRIRQPNPTNVSFIPPCQQQRYLNPMNSQSQLQNHQNANAKYKNNNNNIPRPQSQQPRSQHINQFQNVSPNVSQYDNRYIGQGQNMQQPRNVNPRAQMQMNIHPPAQTPLYGSNNTHVQSRSAPNNQHQHRMQSMPSNSPQSRTLCSNQTPVHPRAYSQIETSTMNLNSNYQGYSTNDTAKIQNQHQQQANVQRDMQQRENMSTNIDPSLIQLLEINVNSNPSHTADFQGSVNRTVSNISNSRANEQFNQQINREISHNPYPNHSKRPSIESPVTKPPKNHKLKSQPANEPVLVPRPPLARPLDAGLSCPPIGFGLYRLLPPTIPADSLDEEPEEGYIELSVDGTSTGVVNAVTASSVTAGAAVPNRQRDVEPNSSSTLSILGAERSPCAEDSRTSVELCSKTQRPGSSMTQFDKVIPGVPLFVPRYRYSDPTTIKDNNKLTSTKSGEKVKTNGISDKKITKKGNKRGPYKTRKTRAALALALDLENQTDSTVCKRIENEVSKVREKVKKTPTVKTPKKKSPAADKPPKVKKIKKEKKVLSDSDKPAKTKERKRKIKKVDGDKVKKECKKRKVMPKVKPETTKNVCDADTDTLLICSQSEEMNLQSNPSDTPIVKCIELSSNDKQASFAILDQISGDNESTEITLPNEKNDTTDKDDTKDKDDTIDKDDNAVSTSSTSIEHKVLNDSKAKNKKVGLRIYKCKKFNETFEEREKRLILDRKKRQLKKLNMTKEQLDKQRESNRRSKRNRRMFIKQQKLINKGIVNKEGKPIELCGYGVYSSSENTPSETISISVDSGAIIETASLTTTETKISSDIPQPVNSIKIEGIDCVTDFQLQSNASGFYYEELPALPEDKLALVKPKSKKSLNKKSLKQLRKNRLCHVESCVDTLIALSTSKETSCRLSGTGTLDIQDIDANAFSRMQVVWNYNDNDTSDQNIASVASVDGMQGAGDTNNSGKGKNKKTRKKSVKKNADKLTPSNSLTECIDSTANLSLFDRNAVPKPKTPTQMLTTTSTESQSAMTVMTEVTMDPSYLSLVPASSASSTILEPIANVGSAKLVIDGQEEDDDGGVPPRMFKKKRKRRCQVSTYDRSKVQDVLYKNPEISVFLSANEKFMVKQGWVLDVEEEELLNSDHNGHLTLTCFESLYGYKRLDVGNGNTISPFMTMAQIKMECSENKYESSPDSICQEDKADFDDQSSKSEQAYNVYSDSLKTEVDSEVAREHETVVAEKDEDSATGNTLDVPKSGALDDKPSTSKNYIYINVDCKALFDKTSVHDDELNQKSSDEVIRNDYIADAVKTGPISVPCDKNMEVSCISRDYECENKNDESVNNQNSAITIMNNDKHDGVNKLESKSEQGCAVDNGAEMPNDKQIAISSIDSESETGSVDKTEGTAKTEHLVHNKEEEGEGDEFKFNSISSYMFTPISIRQKYSVTKKTDAIGAKCYNELLTIFSCQVKDFLSELM